MTCRPFYSQLINSTGLFSSSDLFKTQSFNCARTNVPDWRESAVRLGYKVLIESADQQYETIINFLTVFNFSHKLIGVKSWSSSLMG